MFAGYVESIDAYTCAVVCGQLGAGRTKAGQPIDHAVGLVLSVGMGDKVEAGQWEWCSVWGRGTRWRQVSMGGAQYRGGGQGGGCNGTTAPLAT